MPLRNYMPWFPEKPPAASGTFGHASNNSAARHHCILLLAALALRREKACLPDNFCHTLSRHCTLQCYTLLSSNQDVTLKIQATLLSRRPAGNERVQTFDCVYTPQRLSWQPQSPQAPTEQAHAEMWAGSWIYTEAFCMHSKPSWCTYSHIWLSAGFSGSWTP